MVPRESLHEEAAPGAAGYFLQTPRLGFRRWSEGDLPLAIGLWGDAAVTRYIHAAGLTPVQVRERLAAEIAREREFGVQYWPVFLREGGAHVGCCGLKPREPAERGYELGFHLRSDQWGRGYATEAAAAVIAHAFGTLGAAWLFAGHHPEHPVTRPLLERLGFRYTHHELYPPTGLQHPCYKLARPENALP